MVLPGVEIGSHRGGPVYSGMGVTSPSPDGRTNIAMMGIGAPLSKT